MYISYKKKKKKRTKISQSRIINLHAISVLNSGPIATPYALRKTRMIKNINRRLETYKRTCLITIR